MFVVVIVMNMDEINYKSLRRLQQLEKSSPTITHVESGFYNTLSDYLKGLNDGLSKVDVSSQKHRLLDEEARNTKKIALSIYEQREKKILLAAISKARGGEPDLKNLVDVEKSLFDSVFDKMVEARSSLFEQKPIDSEEPIVSKNEEVDENPENTNPIISVSKNIPEFIGTDTKKYNLRKGDILSIQEDMKDLLVKRNAVREVKKID